MKLRNKKTDFIGYIEYNLRVTDPLTNEPFLTVRYQDDSDVTCFADYKTIKELNEDWEDYKPTEPLIMDEKIRKAVRAWADFNHPHELFVVSVSRIVDEKNNEIKFSGQPFCGLVSMQPTIAELCGEE